MNNIRIKFIRGEAVKYISHLDLMKVFERALRRAGIPIAYSQGFNPHPQMVFGLPLSVGVTSETEYADFEMGESFEPVELLESLNKTLPQGLRVTAAKEKVTKSNIMASISMASYILLVSSETYREMADIKEKLEKFRQMPEIPVKKEGKKGTRELDIKPMIHRMEAVPVNECANGEIREYAEDLSGQKKMGGNYNLDNMFCLDVLMSAGSVANLKPELLVSAINGTEDLKLETVKIHRTGLFIGKGEQVLDPLNSEAL